MQGLQPYLQASGSQGLPNNLLHGHPSLQGECQVNTVSNDSSSLACLALSHLVAITTSRSSAPKWKQLQARWLSHKAFPGRCAGALGGGGAALGLQMQHQLSTSQQLPPNVPPRVRPALPCPGHLTTLPSAQQTPPPLAVAEASTNSLSVTHPMLL